MSLDSWSKIKTLAGKCVVCVSCIINTLSSDYNQQSDPHFFSVWTRSTLFQGQTETRIVLIWRQQADYTTHPFIYILRLYNLEQMGPRFFPFVSKGNHHPLHIYTVECCSSYTKLRDGLFGHGLVEVLETLVAIMFTFLRNYSASGCLNKTNWNVMSLRQN